MSFVGNETWRSFPMHFMAAGMPRRIPGLQHDVRNFNMMIRPSARYVRRYSVAVLFIRHQCIIRRSKQQPSPGTAPKDWNGTVASPAAVQHLQHPPEVK